MKEKAPSLGMTESQLVNALIEEMLYRGIICWRNNNTPVFDATRQLYRKMPKFSMPGIPDIAGIMPDGRALFIEVKLPKGKISPAQAAFIYKAKALRAIAFVARNSQDIHTAFQQAGYRNFGKYVRPDSLRK